MLFRSTIVSLNPDVLLESPVSLEPVTRSLKLSSSMLYFPSSEGRSKGFTSGVVGGGVISKSDSSRSVVCFPLGFVVGAVLVVVTFFKEVLAFFRLFLGMGNTSLICGTLLSASISARVNRVNRMAV